MEAKELQAVHDPPGKALWVVGDLVTLKAGSEDTDGAYSFFELTAMPQAGPPPHIHLRENEAFYILEGSTRSWTTTARSARYPDLTSTSPGAMSTRTKTWGRRPVGYW